MSVSFIDKPYKDESDNLYQGDCGICLDGPNNGLLNTRNYFIIHEGQDGNKHPMHRECVKKWIKNNNTCPGGCGAKITNKLISPIERAQLIAGETMQGASAGAKIVNHNYLIAAFAACTAASLVLFGKWLTQDSLAITGTNSFMAFIGGIAGRFSGNGAGASHRIKVMAPFTAISGGILGLGAFALRWTQDAYLLQALAIGTFVKSAGPANTAKSATIGLGAAFVKTALLPNTSWDKVITTLTGGLGTTVNGNSSDWKLHILPALAGMRASNIAYDRYGAIAATVIGGAVSGVTKVIFDKAYKSFNEEQPGR